MENLLDEVPSQTEDRFRIDAILAKAKDRIDCPLSDMAYGPLVQCWILRALLEFGIHNEVLLSDKVAQPEILAFVGLDEICTAESAGQYDRRQALQLLARRYADLGAQPSRIELTRPMEKSLEWLASRLGLNAVEVDILRFIILAKECEPLTLTLDRLGMLRTSGLQRIFARLLGLPQADVLAALHPEAGLTASGLIEFLNTRELYSDKVRLLSTIVDQVHRHDGHPKDLLRRVLACSRAPRLHVADYPHLASDIAVLRRYLTTDKARRGVNILIYGAPGTGKTEFVRMFAAEIQAPLYEVVVERDGGDPVEGEGRLRSYHFAQRILRHEKEALILFDEIEDVFKEDSDTDFFGRKRSGKKAWMNRLLEDNPVPAFWLSNAIRQIDPAIIRRFDYVLRLEAPPRSVRHAIVHRYFEQLPVRPEWIRQLAAHEHLAPALVERAAKVAASLGDLPAAEVEQAAGRIINGTLEAMALPKTRKECGTSDGTYRLECLNTEPPIAEVAWKLAEYGQGKLCLHGPSGTGKSAFGRYLADRLDRPLLIKRASDLLSPYVGETEMKIAAMFAEAAEEDAVLLLDEADSFLQGREGAVRSWEITQVNEMLTQMEMFEGVFIASTNFMNSLDSATLRRFDLKVRFDWLQPDQIERLFIDQLERLDLPLVTSALVKVRDLPHLTPGDFANVLRQSRLRQFSHAGDLVQALVGEMNHKPQGKVRRIGF